MKAGRSEDQEVGDGNEDIWMYEDTIQEGFEEDDQ